MQIDKTFKKNGLALVYEDNKAIAIVFDFEKFIQEFPSKKYLFKETLYTDINNLSVYCIKSRKYNELIQKYTKLDILDNFFEKLSIDNPQKGKGRSYQYELFYSKKLIIYGHINYAHIKKVTDEFINSLNKLFLKIFSLNSNTDLEKKIILKAIEKVFENQKQITFNDIIDNWEQIQDMILSGGKPEIKSENGMVTVYINEIKVNGNNNNINVQPIIVMPEPIYRKTMASEKELSSFTKQIEENKLKTLRLDENLILSKNKLSFLKQALKFINYLKNQPIKDEYKAKIKIFEYNKKSKTGKLEIINTNLQVKYPKSVPFIFDGENINFENKILNSMIKEEELTIKFNPIINDQIDNKELKKIFIIDII